MRIFPGLEKGAVCIKLHEEELIRLLHVVRHFRAVVPESSLSPETLTAFIEQAENVIARTIVRRYVSEEFTEET